MLIYDTKKTFRTNEFAAEVQEGLTATRRYLKPKYFYDDAGSKLFEEICKQPEYYLTRTETSILRKCKQDILRICGVHDISIIEFGSGSSLKTKILLNEFLSNNKKVFYFPIDVSETMLNDSIDKLSAEFKDLRVIGVCSEYAPGIEEVNVFMEISLLRMRSAEEKVENLRRKMTREVSEIGSLMVYREDVLRTAYIIDDIAGYISGIAFRLYSMNISSLKKGKFDIDLKELVGMVVEAIFKLNEMARALSINPASTIELAQEVQRLERKVDECYRKVIIKALNEIPDIKDLLLLKDVVEGIEGMADKCQGASDCLTILALSM